MTKKTKADIEDANLHKEAVATATAEMPPKILKVSEELSCELNDVEWDNRARELADSIKTHEEQTQRKKDVMKQINADVGKAAAQVTKLGNIVSTRREQREVTVEIKYDYELGRVIKTRTDTNEEVSNREMTDQERQAQLDLMEGSNPSIKDPDANNIEGGDSPFDEDEDDTVRTIRNLDETDDVDLSALADELGVDISDAEVKGDAEATRENVKTAIREEIDRRADLQEQEGDIDESDLDG